MTFVGVCGGRDFQDYDAVLDELARLMGDLPVGAGRLVIVHGDARGADRLADQAARQLRLDVIRVPALWEEFGKGAGPRRNSVIAALPLSWLIAFPGGTGTADMCKRAEAAGIRVLRVGP